jgi:FHA domain
MVMTPVLLVAVVWCAVLLVYAALLVRQALRSPRLDALRLRLLWWWPLLLASPSRLERRIVRQVLAAGIPDRCRRVIWLPDDIEVLVAPRDLRVLGPAAEHLRTRVRRRLEWLARTQACRFHLPPVVAVIDDPRCRPGHPLVRLGFGEATEGETTATATRNGSRPDRPDGPARARRAHLRPLRPPGARRRLPSGRRFRIGRLAACDLVIRDPRVSRVHSVMYEQGGTWYVADEGSTNGTFVNRRRIDRPVRLAESDEIWLGTAVRLRFELDPPAGVLQRP